MRKPIFITWLYASIFVIHLVFNFDTLAADHDYWFHSNGNYKAEKYSILDSIHHSNLDKLKPVWVYNSGHITQTRNALRNMGSLGMEPFSSPNSIKLVKFSTAEGTMRRI